jgi:hypothetical protein
VREVVDRWLSPDHRYFKVVSVDGDTYIIRHDERESRWELVVFKKHGAPDISTEWPRISE